MTQTNHTALFLLLRRRTKERMSLMNRPLQRWPNSGCTMQPDLHFAWPAADSVRSLLNVALACLAHCSCSMWSWVHQRCLLCLSRAVRRSATLLPVSSRSASCGRSCISERTESSIEHAPACIAETSCRISRARDTLGGHSFIDVLFKNEMQLNQSAVRKRDAATTLATARALLVAQPCMQRAADQNCASVQASNDSSAWAAKQMR